MKLKILSCFIYICFNILNSQNTIGILNNDVSSYNGYTLFSPTSNAITDQTYLINNCGEVVHQWSSDFGLAKANYLLENGSLLRMTSASSASSIILPGKSGRVELKDWENNLLWELEISNNQEVMHHDVYPISNGNILILIAKTHSIAEAIQAGRNPELLTTNELLEEYIIEVEPIGQNGYNIVWSWNSWDHLIQDFDVTKSNFGIVSDNPQLMNINFLGLNDGAADWLHYNSIAYNEDLDQIVLSARNTSEFYIIDHSTSTQEAASHSGGNSGKGGDYLYRWGNPQAYNLGDTNDQKSFGQHSVHWIPNNYPNGGKLIFFNNGATRGYSTVDIITPPYNYETQDYDYTNGTTYGPASLDYTYQDPNNSVDFFARFVSSAFMLPNGNILVNNGPQGYFFEINTSTNQKVWEYINPIDVSIGVIPQGSDHTVYTKTIYRTKRYTLDYAAFNGRILTPTGTIETNNENCNLLIIDDLILKNVSIYPNPTKNSITIDANIEIDFYKIYDITGKEVKSSKFNLKLISLNGLLTGVYFINLHSGSSYTSLRIIKL